MTVAGHPFIPFSLPDIGEEEIAEVADSLRSGWITTGPKVGKLEEEFVGLLGHPDIQAVAVNSATAGLHLAVEAVGLGPGDRVITPTHTFTASAEVTRYLGADPLFVDIDLDTYCLDMRRVESITDPTVKAIMPVHFAGHPCDMGVLQGLTKHRQWDVIEDAAHALPCMHGEDLIGTLSSKATVFSFYANKTITTGEGGMLVTRDPDLAARARIMRLHGIDRDAYARFRSTQPAWDYEVVAPGYKYNMTDIAAAIGIHQLRRVHRFHERRCVMATRYDEAFGNLPVILPPRPPLATKHAWHLYIVRLTEAAGITRDELISRLAERGIGTSVHYRPLHLHPYWRDRYHLDPDDFPNSQRLFETGLSLPLYTKMSDDDQQYVIEQFLACFA